MSGHCPNHGPYDGDACPYPPPHGNAERPVNPSLDDDAPTDPGDRRAGGRYDSGEEPTEIPGGGRRNRFLDEDEEETDYGRGGYDDLDMTELDAPSVVTLAMLWVKEGRRRGKTYPIKHGYKIGRKEGDLILEDSKVSEMHARFNMEGNNFVVWDLGSTNGTYVNGKRIRQATVLEENDLVKIGETVFVVKLLEPRPKKRVTSTPSKSQKSTNKKLVAGKK